MGFVAAAAFADQDSPTYFLSLPWDPRQGFIFSNQQDAAAGHPLYFTHSFRGNLTFFWLDYKLQSSYPIGRIYDSTEASLPRGIAAIRQQDFGPGWTLAPGEILQLSEDSSSLTLYGVRGTLLLLRRSAAGTYWPESDATDWIRVERENDGSLTAFLDDSIMTFQAYADSRVHLLTSLRDLRGALFIERREDGLPYRISDDHGNWIEALRLSTGGPTVRRIVEMVSSDGERVGFHYDRRGSLERVTLPAGEEVTMTRNHLGRITGIFGFENRLFFRAAYSSAKLVALDSPTRSIRIRYDGLVTTYLENGVPTEYHHDVNGRVLRSTERQTVQDDSPFDRLEPMDDAGLCVCGEGSCDICMSAWECSVRCGGSGGGGGGGGGCGDECPCNFYIAVDSSTKSVFQPFSFSLGNQVNCTASDTRWTALGSTNPSHTGSTYSTSWQTGGSKLVQAECEGTNKTTTVTVVPACELSLSGPSSPVVGDPATYSATTSCSPVQWTGSSFGCPSSGSGPSFTTTFLFPSFDSITAIVNNGYGHTTVQALSVGSTSCTTSVFGPASALAGQVVCFSAAVTGTSHGLYQWTSPSGTPSSGSSSEFCTTFLAPAQHNVGVSASKSTPCGSVSCGQASRSIMVTSPPMVFINNEDPLPLSPCSSANVSATGTNSQGTPIPGSYIWRTSDPSILSITGTGSQVQVRGLAAGTATLRVDFTSSTGVASDSITVNVSPPALQLAGGGLTLSDTPASYLPEEANEVQYTVSLEPATATSRLRLSLQAVSSHPGAYMNAGTGSGPDFYFHPSRNPGATVSSSGLEITTDNSLNSYAFTVTSQDAGGSATVVAAALDCMPGTPAPQSLPRDSDGDTLPDVWESSSGGHFDPLLSDTDSDGIPDGIEDDDPFPSVTATAGPPHGQTSLGLLGDGLTGFEEYRGFWLGGAHTRTSPHNKDIFILSQVSGTQSFGIGYLGALNSYGIHGLSENAPEWSNEIDKAINFNRGQIPNATRQAAIRLRNRQPTTSGFGPGILGITINSVNGAFMQSPNETDFSEVDVAAHSFLPTSGFVYLPGADSAFGTTDDEIALAAFAYSASEKNDAVRQTIAHEAGHNLHVEHHHLFLDQWLVRVGHGWWGGDFINGSPAIESGSDQICQTGTIAGDDIQVTATGSAGTVCVTTGPNGILESIADLADLSLFPTGQGTPNGTCICAGSNGVLDSPLSGDDQHAQSQVCQGLAIVAGPNGICESRAASTSRVSIMGSELLKPIPMSFDSDDREQVRVHLKW
ncbi:MAG TPA: hypothetical protein VJQ57_09635 [Acidimicrobiia bacterium]|nr:hypothetical protein [Acidimicrobiia bacterium]